MSDFSSPDKTAEDPKGDEDRDVAIDDQVSPDTEAPPVMSGELDFSFVAYDQDITILGAKNSGKSYLANQIMKSLNGVTGWVYDMNQQFHSSRAMVFTDLNEMLKVYDSAKRGHYIGQFHDNSENNFRRFCAEAFKRGNICLILDEVHSFTTKMKQLKEFNNIILSGRPRGISNIVISSRPASLPNNVLSGSKHVFAFKLNLESDLKFLASYLGDDVWILMPPDKRKRLRNLPELEPHTFYYRDMDEDTGRLGKV